jgi:hypothetical protein
MFLESLSTIEETMSALDFKAIDLKLEAEKQARWTQHKRLYGPGTEHYRPGAYDD